MTLFQYFSPLYLQCALIFQTVVLLHTWLACLEENNFVDATSYKPERWLDDLTKKSPFLIVPFGCGKRMCPGKRFIELELQIVLAKVIKLYVILILKFELDWYLMLMTYFVYFYVICNCTYQYNRFLFDYLIHYIVRSW